MTMKAGASFGDKNRIRALHGKGYSLEQISALTRVRPQHVEKIIEQIKAGTLRVSGSQAHYNIGEGDGGDAVPDQKTAEGQVAQALESENASLQAQLKEAQDKLDAAKVESEDPPKRKPGRPKKQPEEEDATGNAA